MKNKNRILFLKHSIIDVPTIKNNKLLVVSARHLKMHFLHRNTKYPTEIQQYHKLYSMEHSAHEELKINY